MMRMRLPHRLHVAVRPIASPLERGVEAVSWEYLLKQAAIRRTRVISSIFDATAMAVMTAMAFSYSPRQFAAITWGRRAVAS